MLVEDEWRTGGHNVGVVLARVVVSGADGGTGDDIVKLIQQQELPQTDIDRDKEKKEKEKRMKMRMRGIRSRREREGKEARKEMTR